MVQIRKVSVENITDVLPLVSQYWRFEGISGFARQPVAEQLERLCSHPDLGSGWLATAQQGAVGYLLAVYVFSLEHLGITAEIDELFILPNHRGRGIGERLLIEAEAEFIRYGCTNTSLQLSKTNDAARMFYVRHGYSDRTRYGLLDKPL